MAIRRFGSDDAIRTAAVRSRAPGDGDGGALETTPLAVARRPHTDAGCSRLGPCYFHPSWQTRSCEPTADSGSGISPTNAHRVAGQSIDTDENPPSDQYRSARLGVRRRLKEYAPSHNCSSLLMDLQQVPQSNNTASERWNIFWGGSFHLQSLPLLFFLVSIDSSVG